VPTTRSLGLDLGDKRIGVAVSVPDTLLAYPLTTLASKDDVSDVEAIIELSRQHQVERIVVGLPRSMDGSLGQQAEKVTSFVKLLSHSTVIPVVMWDERLSTVAAEKLMLESGKSREKRKAQRDAVAAALILQSFLDGQRPPGSRDD
jgi:putative holliday junction resolvase